MSSFKLIQKMTAFKFYKKDDLLTLIADVETLDKMYDAFYSKGVKFITTAAELNAGLRYNANYFSENSGTALGKIRNDIHVAIVKKSYTSPEMNWDNLDDVRRVATEFVRKTQAFADKFVTRKRAINEWAETDDDAYFKVADDHPNESEMYQDMLNQFYSHPLDVCKSFLYPLLVRSQTCQRLLKIK